MPCGTPRPLCMCHGGGAPRRPGVANAAEAAGGEQGHEPDVVDIQALPPLTVGWQWP